MMSDLDQYMTDEVVEKAARAEWERKWVDRPWDGAPDDLRSLCLSFTRASLSAVLPDIIQKAKAEAWDEGHFAGHEDARAVQSTYPQPTLNPYHPSTSKESDNE